MLIPGIMHRSLSLNGLPPEVHLQVFEILNPVTSTCIGLTCKAFYTLHRALWAGPMDLRRTDNEDGSSRCLYEYLHKWMLRHLVFNNLSFKHATFVNIGDRQPILTAYLNDQGRVDQDEDLSLAVYNGFT